MEICDGFVLIASKYEGFDHDKLTADSGASAHMTYNNNGFFEMKQDARKIKIGYGSKISIQESCKLQVT
jgi:hypothetical protein